jgi:hypothetical protein
LISELASLNEYFVEIRALYSFWFRNAIRVKRIFGDEVDIRISGSEALAFRSSFVL